MIAVTTGHRHESTDVAGHRFPPLLHGCDAGGWVLEHAAARDARH